MNIQRFQNLEFIFHYFRISRDIYFDTYAITNSRVFYMSQDLYKSGNILFSEDHSLKTTDGTTTSPIVGSERGHKEGVGSQARFTLITSFIQLTLTNVLVMDMDNHCLRTVDRVTETTATYTGTCQVSGQRDGTDAQFFEPSSIIEDLKNPGNFFIAEYSGRALRYMSVKEGEKNVIALYRGLLGFRNMVQQRSTGNIFLTYNNGVAEYDYLQKTMSSLVGSLSSGFVDGVFSLIQLNFPSGIVLLSDNTILVADSLNNMLRSLDLNTNTSSSICSGILGPKDGKLTSCQLDYPWSLLMINDTLFIGGEASISKIQGR